MILSRRGIFGLCAMLLAIGAATRADIPTLDEAKLVYKYSGEAIFQARDGRVFFYRVHKPDEEKSQKAIAALGLPMPHFAMRDDADESPLGRSLLLGLDAKDQAWFKYSNGEKVEFWQGKSEFDRLEKKNHREIKYNRFNEDPFGVRQNVSWPYVGHTELVDENGTLQIIAKDRLIQLPDLADAAAIEIPFPRLKDKFDTEDLLGHADGLQPYCSQEIYRFGGETWIVRSQHSNVHHGGIFVLRIAGKSAAVVGRFQDKQAGGLVHQGGYVYLFLEDRISREMGGGDGQSTPRSILSVSVNKKEIDAAEIVKQIKLLDAEDFDKREAASRYLETMPLQQVELLEKELPRSGNGEKNLRLTAAIEAVRKANGFTEAAFVDFNQARLKFVDRQGRQYVQEYNGGKAQRAMVITDDVEKSTKTLLPSETIIFEFQGDDGRIYGHDEKFIYALDPNKGECTPLLSIGKVGAANLKVVASYKGLICVSVKRSLAQRQNWSQCWLDPKAKNETPVLAGKKVSDQISDNVGGTRAHPIVTGPDGKLWFLRVWEAPVGERKRPRTTVQLCRVDDKGGVEELTENFLAQENPGLWVLSKDAAIVMSNGSVPIDDVSATYYQEGRTSVYPSLLELVDRESGNLLNLPGDAFGFYYGEMRDPTWLVRFGKTIYVRQEHAVAAPGRTGIEWFDGFYVKGQWVNMSKAFGSGEFRPTVSRVVAVDPATKRMLVFFKDCKTLSWLDPETMKEEVVAKNDRDWAWMWPPTSGLPRLSSCWMLAPEAGKRTAERQAEREAAEKENRKATSDDGKSDFSQLQRWNGKEFEKIDGEVLGGTLSDDAQGNLWSARSLEVKIYFRDGHTQTLATDQGLWDEYRLTVESPTVVWLASGQSISRYELRGEKNEAAFERTARHQLPQLGAEFAGPWIAGKTIYWTIGTTLYSRPLAELAK